MWVTISFYIINVTSCVPKYKICFLWACFYIHQGQFSRGNETFSVIGYISRVLRKLIQLHVANFNFKHNFALWIKNLFFGGISYCSNHVDIQHHIPYWMVIMTYYCLMLVKVLCPDSYELYTHVELICLLHNCMIKQYAYIRIVFSMYRFIREISENYFYIDLS